MSERRTPPGLDLADYDQIEAAVKETARGRWFLAEHAKRNRHADTETILAALAKLERAVAAAGGGRAAERLLEDVADLTMTIAALRRRLAGEGTAPGDRSRDPLRGVVSDAHEAAAALGDTARDFAERIAALAESGADPRAVAALARRAEALGLIAELETLTARRLGWAMDTIAHLEARLAALAPTPSRPTGSPESVLIEAERFAELPEDAADVPAPIPATPPPTARFTPSPRAMRFDPEARIDPPRRPPPRASTLPPNTQPPAVRWDRPRPPEPPRPDLPRRPLTLDELAALSPAERLKYFT